MSFSRSLLLLGSAAGLHAAPQLLVGDAQDPKSYVVDCSQLQCRPGDVAAHPVALQVGEETLDGLAAELRRKKAATGAQFDLIVYPEGQKPTAKNRRTISRQIAVSEKVAQQIDVPADCQLVPHATAPGWFLLVHADAVAAVRSFQKLSAQYGLDDVRVLLRKKRSKREIPTDPRFSYSSSNAAYQWHLRNTGQNSGVAGIDANIIDVWDSYKGSGISIGIVDDGLENAHPDLFANADTTRDRNWNSGNVDDSTPSDAQDDHGTSCGGVSAARDGNGEGGVGAAPRATLVGLRLIAGDVGDSEEAEAMGWERDTIHIYSNSWGPDDEVTSFEAPGPLFVAAIEAGLENGRGGKGSIYTFAGGNGHQITDNSNYDGYANLPGTIAIGACDDDGVRAEYSERGANLVISAPSDGMSDDQSITTTTLTQNGSYTDGFGGTSSATPLVSGVIALMLEANADLGWRDVQEILIRTARKVHPTNSEWSTNSAGLHFNHDYGAGIVDAGAAVAMVQGWTNLGTRREREIDAGTVNITIPGSYTFDFSNVEPTRVEHAVLTMSADGANVGSLLVTLTAPDGTVSQLVEPHNSTDNSITDWAFSSVRHWGTTSVGEWRLDISRPLSGGGGTLTAAKLTLSGTDGEAGELQTPTILSPAMAQGNVNAPFSYQIAGSWQPTSFAATGLPAWATVDGNGLITGTPTVEGSFSFDVSATNAQGTGEQTVTLTVAPAAGALLAAALEQPSLSFATVASEGEWTVIDGDSPVGASHIQSEAIGDSRSQRLSTSISLAEPSQVSFWWRTSTERGFDEVLFVVEPATPAGLSGITDWQQVTIELPAGVHDLQWIFARDGDTGAGSNTVSLDGLQIVALADLEETATELYQRLLSTHLVFENRGVNWLAEEDAFAAGRSGLRTPTLGNSLSAVLTTTVTGPGTLSFDLGCSTEDRFDTATFAIDGVVQLSIDGETPVQQLQFSIGAGEHELRWRYLKDSQATDGDDAVYLDRLRYVREGSYEEYVAGNFTEVEQDDYGRTGASADFDGDGRSNFLEWLTETNARTADPFQPMVIDAEGASVWIRQGAVEADYEIQSSENLVDWDGIGSTETPDGNLLRLDLDHDSGFTRRFYRFEAVQVAP